MEYPVRCGFSIPLTASGILDHPPSRVMTGECAPLSLRGAASSPLPPRSGGVGWGVGVYRRSSHRQRVCRRRPPPPTPLPTIRLRARVLRRMVGGEITARSHRHCERSYSSAVARRAKAEALSPISSLRHSTGFDRAAIPYVFLPRVQSRRGCPGQARGMTNYLVLILHLTRLRVLAASCARALPGIFAPN